MRVSADNNDPYQFILPLEITTRSAKKSGDFNGRVMLPGLWIYNWTQVHKLRIEDLHIKIIY